VRDVDDGQTAGFEPADDLEQRRHLGVGQGRGRLVHDHEPGVEREGLGDLDHLLLGHRQGADDRSRVQMHPELVEQIGGLLAKLAPADDLTGIRFPPDEDVLFDREVGHEVELLIDDGDAEVLRLARAVEHDRLPVEDDLAGVRLIDPGEDLHQGALAGAVLADQPQDLAGMDFETDVLQRQHAGEALGDPLDPEQGRSRRFIRSSRFALDHARARSL
jgi:hypothetical protein